MSSPSLPTTHQPASNLTPNKQTWTLWDAAWELDIPRAQRISHLSACLSQTSQFSYTNPEISLIGETTETIVNYIEKALEATGNKLQVKHRQWMENNCRSALHWDLDDMTTSQAALHGWSYAQYDNEGKLVCVADFW